jgi:hypothetical protein
MIAAATAVLAAALTSPALAGEITKKLTGDVTVNSRTDETRQPVSPPKIIYVKDFDLGYDTAQQDPGGGGRPIVGRILPRMSQRDDPAKKAGKLVELMSDSLVSGFSRQGIDARRLLPGMPLPEEGWLINGVFTEIDQGKRVIRATIGFGTGATNMEVNVSVSDLGGNPGAPFIIFGTEKDPGKMPGAVVSMNPYVAAAKFVMEKNASDKDVKKTANQIVAELVKYMESLGKMDGAPQKPQ